MFITNLYDSIGNKYIGFDINEASVSYYNDVLLELLGDNFNIYKEKKLHRDNGNYHITVLNVAHLNKLLKENIEYSYLYNKEYILNFRGIGSIEKGDNSTYFIVIECEELQKDLEKLGITNVDLHITLGFKIKDIFKQRKNITNIYDNHNNQI